MRMCIEVENEAEQDPSEMEPLNETGQSVFHLRNIF